jgi:hypothetical protein
MRTLRAWMGGWLAGACTACSTILGIGDPTVGPGDDGGPTAAPPASGQLGAACAVVDDCVSTECLTFVPNDQNLSGLCTSPCTSSADCGPRGACVPQTALQESVCFLTCSTTADCAQGAVCEWNSSISSGFCTAIPSAFCSSLSGQTGCDGCVASSCCSELKACVADVECGKLESGCTSGGCATALQGSTNGAASAISRCVASQCSMQCSSSGGVTPPPMGGTDGATPDLTPFLGTWQLERGTESLSGCSDGTSDATASESTSLQLQVVRGTTSDLVATYVGGSGCSFKANVQGSVAVAPTPQTCNVGQAGYTLTLTAGTFGVSGNTAQISATATYQTTSGQPVTCTDDIQETFSKL